MLPKYIGQSSKYYLLYDIQRKLDQLVKLAPNGNWGKETAEKVVSKYVTRVQESGGVVEGVEHLTSEIQHLKDIGVWDKLSAAWIPSGYAEGKLYAVKGPDLGFTRAGTRTRVGPSGLVEEVPLHVPAIDFTGGTPKLSLEKGSTNLFLNSEVLETQNVTVTAVPYTVSHYGTGTITFSGAYTGELVGVEGERVELTFNPTAGTLTCTVSGTVEKAQLEQGSYATSYIPTGAATASRVADAIPALINISDYIGQSKGSWFVDWAPMISDSAQEINIDDGSPSNRLRFSINAGATNLIVSVHALEGINQASVSIPFTYGERHRILLTYKEDEFNVYVDGAQVLNDISGVVPVGMSVLRFTHPTASRPAVANIHRMLLFQEVLGPEQATALTTIES